MQASRWWIVLAVPSFMVKLLSLVSGHRRRKAKKRELLGTLMIPEILYTVCYADKHVSPEISQLHTFEPAVLHGYSRRRRLGNDTPAIIEDSDHQVSGTLVTGLTDTLMLKLDYFEGREYYRKSVKVKLLAPRSSSDKSRQFAETDEITAEVYVFLDKSKLEEEEWDLEEFYRDRLQAWTQPGFVEGRCDPDVPAIVTAD
ncbi:hypothetical protein F4777DRAFT_577415 [Nemania sp. FL0916]|nr:hypothetical protein F4777DRAFT_577415 [Nemania sp. FL0916]